VGSSTTYVKFTDSYDGTHRFDVADPIRPVPTTAIRAAIVEGEQATGVAITSLYLY
jgi:hypothetical protein